MRTRLAASKTDAVRGRTSLARTETSPGRGRMSLGLGGTTSVWIRPGDLALRRIFVPTRFKLARKRMSSGRARS
jgi:hypothetical protein